MEVLLNVWCAVLLVVILVDAIECRYYRRVRARQAGTVTPSPRRGSVVVVTHDIDPTKTVVATHISCGCPVYAEDLPIREWLCEHGNQWTVTGAARAIWSHQSRGA